MESLRWRLARIERLDHLVGDVDARAGEDGVLEHEVVLFLRALRRRGVAQNALGVDEAELAARRRGRWARRGFVLRRRGRCEQRYAERDGSKMGHELLKSLYRR